MKRVVDELTGFRHMIPTHQGRAAERILFTVLCPPGHVVPNNTHFDATRANIEFMGAPVVDLPIPEAQDTQARIGFKSNMDVAALAGLIEIGQRGLGFARFAPRLMPRTNRAVRYNRTRRANKLREVSGESDQSAPEDIVQLRFGFGRAEKL